MSKESGTKEKGARELLRPPRPYCNGHITRGDPGQAGTLGNLEGISVLFRGNKIRFGRSLLYLLVSMYQASSDHSHKVPLERPNE